MIRIAVAVATAWLWANTTARWFGQRIGLTAGGVLVLLTIGELLRPAPLEQAWVALWAAACLSGFAWGNVPGRLPPHDAHWIRRGFYVAAALAALTAGFGGLLCVVVTCGLYLFLLQDRRGARFVADPLGWALAAGLAGLAVGYAWQRGWYTEMRLDVSLWDAACRGAASNVVAPIDRGLFHPAANELPGYASFLVALGVTLWAFRQGHAAAPIWRLLLCWLIGAAAAVALGLFSWERCALMIAPVVATLTAIALVALARHAFRHSSLRGG